jgi:NAD(P)-dependent dehydrogenase (short-subunit alcohol dehydrogenase family)
MTSRTDTVGPTYDYTGQVALITGASSGIGLATAQAFADSGAAVALVDVDADGLLTATEALTAAGHSAIGVPCDVADEDQVADMMATVVERLGRVDCAFNNAGIQVEPTDAADQEGEAFDRVTRVNLRGVWVCMKHELRHMRTRGSGAIVNNSSLGGLIGQAMRGPYHSSKHGVIGLTKSAALEYAERGIRINAVCPGAVETPMVSAMLETQRDALQEIIRSQPIGRLGQPSEIAAAVLWLCSPGASFVVGAAVPVDGGFTA